MKKTKKYTKIIVLLCCMTFLTTLNVYANHTHTDKCYGGTKHICNGNETTYGSCYTNKNVTYHTHIGKEGTTPNGCYTKENVTYHTHIGKEGTTPNGCYTKENVTYHTHIGKEGTTPNGCYTKENIIYHKHDTSCYKENNNECQHTIDMGSSNNLKIMDYHNCPNCSNEDFYGYTHSLSCGSTIQLYAGECENCGYKGSATITKTIINNNPAQISYSHNVATNELNCGKTEQTIEKTSYTLNCGKTEQTIEKTSYALNCGKTEQTIEKTSYTLNCGKTEQTIEKTSYIKTCKKTNGNYYNSKGEKILPTCNQVVVSVKPKTEKQKTLNPDFAIVATYLDGHIAEIKPSIANYNKNKIYENEKITLTYNGFIGNASNKSSISTYIYLTTPVTITPTQTVTPTPTKKVTPTPTITSTPTTTPTIIVVPTTIPTQTEKIENENSNINVDIDGSFVLENPIINNNKENNTKEELEKNNENNTFDLLGNIPSNSFENKEEQDKQEVIEQTQNSKNEKDTPITNNNDKIIITIVIFIILLCFLILLILSIILLNKKEKKGNVEDIDNIKEYNTNNLKNDEINIIPPIINGSDNNYK